MRIPPRCESVLPQDPANHFGLDLPNLTPKFQNPHDRVGKLADVDFLARILVDMVEQRLERHAVKVVSTLRLGVFLEIAQ